MTGFQSLEARYVVPSFIEHSSYGTKESNPYNKLFEERIVFLGSQVDDASADDVMAQLLVLEAMDSERDITTGGVAMVPADTFDGVAYGALGHLHRPQQVADHDQVTGAGNWQELGQAFHYAQDQGLKGHPDIHQIPQSAATTYA